MKRPEVFYLETHDMLVVVKASKNDVFWEYQLGDFNFMYHYSPREFDNLIYIGKL